MNVSFPTRKRVVVSEGPKVEDVSSQEAVGLHEAGAVLLDVREDDEWAAGHAPDAIHVPLAGVGEPPPGSPIRRSSPSVAAAAGPPRRSRWPRLGSRSAMSVAA